MLLNIFFKNVFRTKKQFESSVRFLFAILKFRSSGIYKRKNFKILSGLGKRFTGVSEYIVK